MISSVDPPPLLWGPQNKASMIKQSRQADRAGSAINWSDHWLAFSGNQRRTIPVWFG